MLALHLLQICLVYINTLFIQEVLADLVNPYGRFELDMATRLALAA
jgi:hypothetical protein